MPEQLRTSERDQGFNFTRSMTRVQVAYAVDKIMRNSGNTNRKEQVIADLGCGGGYISANLNSLLKLNTNSNDMYRECGCLPCLS